ncbi:unnamed protein product [Larinioides sclopetarius]|uniref:Uncharacterized protein n=1 Tax=Larinioides sclopetarius TaxID=280406 RepID=A0AAV2BZC1_9ARAC
MMFRFYLSAVKTDQWLPPKKSHVGVFDVTCIRSILTSANFRLQEVNKNESRPNVGKRRRSILTDGPLNIPINDTQEIRLLQSPPQLPFRVQLKLRVPATHSIIRKIQIPDVLDGLSENPAWVVDEVERLTDLYGSFARAVTHLCGLQSEFVE